MCVCVLPRQITLASLAFHTNVLAQKNEIRCGKAKEFKKKSLTALAMVAGFTDGNV